MIIFYLVATFVVLHFYLVTTFVVLADAEAVDKAISGAWHLSEQGAAASREG
jgi:hypothetical protein